MARSSLLAKKAPETLIEMPAIPAKPDYFDGMELHFGAIPVELAIKYTELNY